MNISDKSTLVRELAISYVTNVGGTFDMDDSLEAVALYDDRLSLYSYDEFIETFEDEEEYDDE